MNEQEAAIQNESEDVYHDREHQALDVCPYCGKNGCGEYFHILQIIPASPGWRAIKGDAAEGCYYEHLVACFALVHVRYRDGGEEYCETVIRPMITDAEANLEPLFSFGSTYLGIVGPGQDYEIEQNEYGDVDLVLLYPCRKGPKIMN